MTTRPMPLYVVRSAPVRSPEPAAPIQCTSGQAGSAPAVPADRPTNAAPATAAAPASAEIRRNIRTPTLLGPPGPSRSSSPQPSHVLPRWRRDRRNGAIYSHFRARLSVWAKRWAQTKAAPTRRRAPLRGTARSLDDHVGRAYLMILVTRPAPTVRPPSRIAKRRPSSMATGWISFTEMSVLSPGMTISVPSGSVTTPVTSVVRK